MGRRIGGRDFDVMLGDLMIHVENMTASIDDSSAVSKTKGTPNGDVDGEVGCSGELELDTQNFNLVIEVARKAKSFKRLKPFDIVTVAEGDDDKFKLEMFGCKLRISDLLSIDSKGGEKAKHKIPFDVTDPDFVRINGVPYLDSDMIKNIR